MLVVLALVVLAVGCGRKPASLHGIWKPDVDKGWAAMKDGVAVTALPEAARKSFEDGFRKTMWASSFTFSEGKLAFSLGPVSQEGEFKVISSKGDAWDVEVKNSTMDKPMAAKLTWTDDDHVTLGWTVNGLPVTFYLVRQK